MMDTHNCDSTADGTATCNDCYRESDGDRTQDYACTDDSGSGLWDPASITCVQQTCEDFTRPNGNPSNDTDIACGSTESYDCQECYEFPDNTKSKNITCIDDKKNVIKPDITDKCAIIECPGFSDPNRDECTDTGVYSEGTMDCGDSSTCTCNMCYRYESVGNAQRSFTCNSSGVFDVTETCALQFCNTAGPTQVGMGTWNLNTNAKDETCGDTDGGTFDCDDCYRHDDRMGSPKSYGSVCIDDGKGGGIHWDPSTLTCTVQSCQIPRPNSVQGTTGNADCGADSVPYTCVDSCYEFTDGSSMKNISCIDDAMDGIELDDADTCGIKSCGDLGGAIGDTSGIESCDLKASDCGDVESCMCNECYYFGDVSMSQTYECLDNKTWSNNAGCIRKVCDVPFDMSLANANIDLNASDLCGGSNGHATCDVCYRQDDSKSLVRQVSYSCISNDSTTGRFDPSELLCNLLLTCPLEQQNATSSTPPDIDCGSSHDYICDSCHTFGNGDLQRTMSCDDLNITSNSVLSDTNTCGNVKQCILPVDTNAIFTGSLDCGGEGLTQICASGYQHVVAKNCSQNFTYTCSSAISTQNTTFDQDFTQCVYCGSKETQATAACQCSSATDACFPEKALIKMADGSDKEMRNLEIADEILSADSAGNLMTSKVVMFFHRDVKETPYVELKTKSGRILSVTSGHIVFKSGQQDIGNLIEASSQFAADIRVGDWIFVADKDGAKPEQVTDIKNKMKMGAYAPVTEHGQLIVDGVVASSYAVYKHQHAIHWSLSPFRLFDEVLHNLFGLQQPQFPSANAQHKSWLEYFFKVFYPLGTHSLWVPHST